MTWTGKSGWFGKRFSGSKIPGSRPGLSAKRRRQRLAAPPAETLEVRQLLSGTGTPELIDTDHTIEINGFPKVPAAISPAGDVNGDGFDDLIVGFGEKYSNDQRAAGKSWVVFGRGGDLPERIDVNELDGESGFAINGFERFGFTGGSVSEAGDFNGDGLDDLIVSDTRNHGAFIVFGRREFAANVELSSIDGSTGFRMHSGRRHSGQKVSQAGDFNGDGLADVILSSPDYVQGIYGSPTIIPGAYVVYGREDPGTGALDLSAMSADDGLTIFTPDGVRDIDNVAGGGDFNGDGFADVALRSRFFPVGINSGSVFIVFGQESFDEPFDLADLDGTNGFSVTGSASIRSIGQWVDVPGDINGDGMDDLLLGHRGNQTEHSYDAMVVYGRANDNPAAVADFELDGDNGFHLNFSGVPSDDGLFANAAGDFDGDGLNDVVSMSLLLFGSDAGFPLTSDNAVGAADAISVDDILSVDVKARHVTIGIGDFNGDGYDDFLVSEPIAAGRRGSMFIVLGRGSDAEFRPEGTRAGADVVRAEGGASVSDVLVGGQANDSLIGDGGPDVLYGGQGDDHFEVSETDFRRVAGGSGRDTLKFTGDNSSLDLTAIADSRLVDIEAIDLRNSGINSLVVNRREVLNLSSTSNTVRILKDAEDVVEMGDGWALTRHIVDERREFAVYIQGEAKLEIEVPPSSVLTPLNGFDGFQLVSGEDDGKLGDDIRSIGDMNGDGYDDLLITSPVDNDLNIGRGQAYVVFGEEYRFDASLEPATELDGSNGFVVTAEQSGEEINTNIRPAGDFNADGLADLIVLSEDGDSGVNRSHIIFGWQGDFPARLDVNQLDGVTGFSIQDGTGLDFQQSTVTGLGDANEDGIVDVFIGGSTADSVVSGDPGGFVVYGQERESFETFSLADITGESGFRVEDASTLLNGESDGSANSRFDFNADGLVDTILDRVSMASSERVIVFGNNGEPQLPNDPTELADFESFVITSPPGETFTGTFMTGDLNGDGFDDPVFVTASESGRDAVYVLLGSGIGADGTLTEGAKGTSRHDRLRASAGVDATDVLVGRSGNDTLISDGGPDALTGGHGDDLLVVRDEQFRMIDGGVGFDTLELGASLPDLDLLDIPEHSLSNIEVIDLYNRDPNTLTLNAQEVLSLNSTSNRLRILKDSEDTLNIGEGWTRAGTATLDRERFSVWQNGLAELEIQELRGTETGESGQFYYGLSGSRDRVDGRYVGQTVTLSRNESTGYFELRMEADGDVSHFSRHDPDKLLGITLRMKDGDDFVSIDTLDIPVTIVGGGGNDTVVIKGTELADEMLLQPAFSLHSPVHEDLLNVAVVGEDAVVRDRLLIESVEDLRFDLLENDDTLNVESFEEANTALMALSVNLGSGDDVLDAPLVGVEVAASGGAGSDTLISSSGDDTLNGGGGDDSLEAGWGADVLLGGSGDDVMFGGDGNDRLRGHSGVDTLDGAEGVDMLDGGRHSTHLRDQVSGTLNLSDDGYVTANGDHARSDGGFASVSLSGGDGADELNSSAFTGSDVTLNGGDGDDDLAGDTSHELIGGTGQDHVSVAGRGAAGRNARLNAGDHLILTGVGQTINLTEFATSFGGSVIDVRGSGSNSVKLRRESLGASEAGIRQLAITRDANDDVDIGDGWVLQQAGRFGGSEVNPHGLTIGWQDEALLLTDTFGFPTLTEGTLRYVDDIGYSNYVSLSYDAVTDEIILDLTYDVPASSSPIGPAPVLRFAAADVSAISIDLGAGRDELTLQGLTIPVSVSGGGGTDMVRLIGTDDAEQFRWSTTDDGELRIDQANQVTRSSMTLEAPGFENVVIDARGGDDRVFALVDGTSLNSVSHVMAHLGSGNDSFTMPDFGFSMNVNGASGNDVIFTGEADDTLTGGAGDDLLGAYGGNDRVRGQGGDDLVSGGTGIDTLDGGSGETSLVDSIDGEVQLTDDGYETENGDIARASGRIQWAFLQGGEGDDMLSAQQFTSGNVTLAGGAGNDILLGGRNDDVLAGEVGNDSLLGAMGDDYLNGGDGNDRLRGHGGHDLLVGGGGNDFLDGATGHDRLEGDDGDDTLIGMNGNDTLGGGLGDDLIDGGGGATTLREVANVDMTLSSEGGSTVLRGLGDDTIVGRVTVGILTGGATANRLDASRFSGRVALSGGMGNDILIGTSRDDTIDGGAARDSIEAGAGNDVVYGGFGDDRIFGGIGADTLIGEKGDDTLNGADGADILIGEKGDDSLNGGSGADRVAGGGNGFISTDGDRIADGASEINESLTAQRRELIDGI